MAMRFSNISFLGWAGIPTPPRALPLWLALFSRSMMALPLFCSNCRSSVFPEPV